MKIKFYSPRNPWGEFSNFLMRSIYLDNNWWPTTEHYFQAKKYEGTPREDVIRMTPTPMEAAQMGRDRSYPIRADWEQIKDSVMKKALIAKFTQHEDLKTILQNTGDNEIVEDSPIDYYWGIGAKGTGSNKLGLLLMEVRKEIC